MNLNLLIKNIIKTLFIVLIIIFYSNNVITSENRIIFKINDKAFTLFDLEKRKEYLDFVGNNNNIDRNTIINDFLSANLFYEYFIQSNNTDNYKNKIEEIFKNILNTNDQNNKKYTYEINKNNLLKNIEIDYIRKIVLENILNSIFNNLDTNSEEIDLLYNLKIKYISFKKNDYNKLKGNISNLKFINYEEFKSYLNQNNINFLAKEKEINDIKKIDKRIKANILSNNNFFFIEKENLISVIFIDKSFETFEGIIADLYSVRSIEEIEKDFLKCDNLSKIKNNINIISKEYKMINLNNDLKSNLISINDYVKYSNENENVYIVLCNIKFDKEMLNNFNLNKLINLNVNKIETKFIKKYSKLFNLIKYDE